MPPLVMAGGAVGPSGFGVRPHFSFAHLAPKDYCGSGGEETEESWGQRNGSNDPATRK